LTVHRFLNDAGPSEVCLGLALCTGQVTPKSRNDSLILLLTTGFR
jgi:hypothetical protein